MGTLEGEGLEMAAIEAGLTTYDDWVAFFQGGGGATTALDNLASVAINTSLISDTNNTDDLGSTGVRWRKLWAVDGEFTNLPTINDGTLASALSLGTMASAATADYKTAAQLASEDTGLGASLIGVDDDFWGAGQTVESTLQGFSASITTYLVAFLVPATASNPAAVTFYEDTDNGTNKITLTAPASIASDKTATLQDKTGTVALMSDITELMPAYTTNKFYTTTPIGTTFTATNTTPLVDDTAYAVFQIANSDITISTITVRTSSSNASNTALVKIGIYAADGAGGTPGTRLGHTATGTAIGNSATNTDYTIALDSATAVPAGPFFIAILQDSTTGARFNCLANAFILPNVTGSSTAAGIFGGTGVIYGYTMAQAYASGMPSTFTSGGELNTIALAPTFIVEVD